MAGPRRRVNINKIKSTTSTGPSNASSGEQSLRSRTALAVSFIFLFCMLLYSLGFFNHEIASSSNIDSKPAGDAKKSQKNVPSNKKKKVQKKGNMQWI